MHRILAASLALVLLGSSPQPAMPAGARTALTRYLDALHAGRYDDAYGLLARAERAYFKTPANFASVSEKCRPISPIAAAPKIASVIACNSTSASECPSSPRS